MRRLSFVVLALSVMVSAACASGPPGESTGPSRGSGTITREDLAALSQFDAFQVVRRLRPQWLRSLRSLGGRACPTPPAALQSPPRLRRSIPPPNVSVIEPVTEGNGILLHRSRFTRISQRLCLRPPTAQGSGPQTEETD